jgi:hypothetical protein
MRMFMYHSASLPSRLSQNAFAAKAKAEEPVGMWLFMNKSVV